MERTVSIILPDRPTCYNYPTAVPSCWGQRGSARQADLCALRDPNEYETRYPIHLLFITSTAVEL
jgi:hypothetical protein